MPAILRELKSYLKIKWYLLRYETVDRLTPVSADIAVDLLVFLLLMVSAFFGTVALGLYLSFFLSLWAGFGSVAILYLLLALIFRITHSRIHKKVANILTAKLLKKP